MWFHNKNSISIAFLFVLVASGFAFAEELSYQRDFSEYVQKKYSNKNCQNFECLSFAKTIIDLSVDTLNALREFTVGSREEFVKIFQELDSLEKRVAYFQTQNEYNEIISELLAMDSKIENIQNACRVVLGNVSCHIALDNEDRSKLTRFVKQCVKKPDCATDISNKTFLTNTLGTKLSRLFFYAKSLKNFESQIVDNLYLDLQSDNLENNDVQFPKKEEFALCIKKLTESLVAHGFLYGFNTKKCKSFSGGVSGEKAGMLKQARALMNRVRSECRIPEEKKAAEENFGPLVPYNPDSCYDDDHIDGYCFRVARCIRDNFIRNGFPDVQFIQIRNWDAYADNADARGRAMVEKQVVFDQGGGLAPVSFGYHVAVSFEIEGDMFVMDPACSKKPMPVYDWISRFQTKGQFGAIVSGEAPEKDLTINEMYNFSENDFKELRCQESY